MNWTVLSSASLGRGAGISRFLRENVLRIARLSFEPCSLEPTMESLLARFPRRGLWVDKVGPSEFRRNWICALFGLGEF